MHTVAKTKTVATSYFKTYLLCNIKNIATVCTYTHMHRC